MGRDQNDVAARVIATGAGVRLSPKASVQAIRVAITGVLAETRYRAQARRMAELLAREDGAVHGADELEAVARGASSGRTSNLPEEGGSAPQKFPRHP
jgi:UDP:flavonoid glycosyltransferase YjiC (YdhE family)